MIHIVDLDNCIADDGWRIRHIAWQHENPFDRYHAYHSLAPFDVLRNEHILATKSRIVVFTARPVHYAHATREWLERNDVHPLHILMRNNHDHRPSVQLKEWQLDCLLAHHDVHIEEILMAHDDRQDICDMFERRGIPATRTFIHNNCAYTRPTP